MSRSEEIAKQISLIKKGFRSWKQDVWELANENQQKKIEELQAQLDRKGFFTIPEQRKDWLEAVQYLSRELTEKLLTQIEGDDRGA